MIKVQGFGRRRTGMRHEECVRHHREVHSKLGLAQGEHMEKYVLYYVQRAFSSDGAPLHDLPWDMSALEWYREEERWTDFLRWLEEEPDGR
ncbi:MAG: hypothetical protein C0489_11235, partial [Candidatus Accumulibacter sp.]|nr:hypothetical protein [Accumulibacter sp.]